MTAATLAPPSISTPPAARRITTPAPVTAPANGVPRTATAIKLATPCKPAGQRIIMYGPGGIGKTTLAAIAPGPVAFIDLDDSLPRLWPTLKDVPGVNVQVVPGIETWQHVRDALHADGWSGVKTIVIDTLTRAEELAVAHTLATVPHEKGQRVARVEDYGFGKGYSHVYDTFLTLLGDLDQHTRAGRNVVLVCHDCTATVPNPDGEDWIRYEPRLQSPNSGKASIRLRVREWADHLLFIGYDVSVKEGKGKGSGTRTCYPNELPHCMAKSRTLAAPVPLARFDGVLWTLLEGGAQ